MEGCGNLDSIFDFRLNWPPEFNELFPEEFVFNEDENLVQDFVIYLNDFENDEITLSVSGNENIYISLDGLDVSFSSVQDWNGSESITFFVEDDSGEGTGACPTFEAGDRDMIGFCLRYTRRDRAYTYLRNQFDADISFRIYVF